jgi:hypothetical protein
MIIPFCLAKGKICDPVLVVKAKWPYLFIYWSKLSFPREKDKFFQEDTPPTVLPLWDGEEIRKSKDHRKLKIRMLRWWTGSLRAVGTIPMLIFIVTAEWKKKIPSSPPAQGLQQCLLPALFALGYFSDRVSLFLPWIRLGQQSSYLQPPVQLARPVCITPPSLFYWDRVLLTFCLGLTSY